jgi:SYP7 family syntaxin
VERLEFRLKRLSGLQKSQDAQSEKNRAVVATLNAEVRRSKAALKAEIPKLEMLAAKKVKDLSKEEMAARPDLVIALSQKIEDIPDGVTVGRRGGTWGQKASNPFEIKLDAMHPGKVQL